MAWLGFLLTGKPIFLQDTILTKHGPMNCWEQWGSKAPGNKEGVRGLPHSVPNLSSGSTRPFPRIPEIAAALEATSRGGRGPWPHPDNKGKRLGWLLPFGPWPGISCFHYQSGFNKPYPVPWPKMEERESRSERAPSP